MDLLAIGQHFSSYHVKKDRFDIIQSRQGSNSIFPYFFISTKMLQMRFFVIIALNPQVEMKIIQKDTKNGMRYLVELDDGKTEWKQFDDLIDHIGMIIEYESENKGTGGQPQRQKRTQHSIKPSPISQNALQNYQQTPKKCIPAKPIIRSKVQNQVCKTEEAMISVDDQKADQPQSLDNNPISEGKVIKELIFMEPKSKSNGKVYKFKVKFQDGSFKITDNAALRTYCPWLLIDFYEKHIHVNFN